MDSDSNGRIARRQITPKRSGCTRPPTPTGAREALAAQPETWRPSRKPRRSSLIASRSQIGKPLGLRAAFKVSTPPKMLLPHVGSPFSRSS